MVIEPLAYVKVDLSSSYYPFSPHQAKCILISRTVAKTGLEIWSCDSYRDFINLYYSGDLSNFLYDLSQLREPVRIYMDRIDLAEFLLDFFNCFAPPNEANRLYLFTCDRAAIDLCHLITPIDESIRPQLEGWSKIHVPLNDYNPHPASFICKNIASKLPFELLLADYLCKGQSSEYLEYFYDGFFNVLNIRFFHDIRKIKDFLIWSTDRMDSDILSYVRNQKLINFESYNLADIIESFSVNEIETLIDSFDSVLWNDLEKQLTKKRIFEAVRAYKDRDPYKLIRDLDFWEEMSTVAPLRVKINFRLVFSLIEGRINFNLPKISNISSNYRVLSSKNSISIDTSEFSKRDLSKSLMGERYRYPYTKPEDDL